MISKYQKLSEDFIREFQNKVNWYLISRCQKLSEEFIREFQEKVDWIEISLNQNIQISKRFIFELYLEDENKFNTIKSYIPEVTEFCLELENQIPRLFLEFKF